MKKFVILSVNYNVDYLWFLPLTAWAWRKLGWEVLVFYNGPDTPAWRLSHESTKEDYTVIGDIDLYRSDTITQISRLYGACVIKDAYLMTSDVDMIPLKDYWQYNESDITIWGHDLTGYGHYPICYLGMTSQRWIEVMGLTSDRYWELVKRDLDSLPQAQDPDFYKYWFCDQDLITQRIKDVQFQKTFINRGQLPNGYARGRVDRGQWSLDQPELIDCHALRDCYKLSDTGRQNFAKTMRLLEFVWPNENFDWLRTYTAEFQKLANNG